MTTVLRLKLGDYECVQANPQLLRIAEKIVDQNSRLIALNDRLVEALIAPICIVTPATKEDA